MRKCFWLNTAAGHLLHTIIAYSGGGIKSFFYISLFQDIPLTMRMVGPNAGKEIGLQLQSYG